MVCLLLKVMNMYPKLYAMFKKEYKNQYILFSIEKYWKDTSINMFTVPGWQVGECNTHYVLLHDLLFSSKILCLTSTLYLYILFITYHIRSASSPGNIATITRVDMSSYHSMNNSACKGLECSLLLQVWPFWFFKTEC